MSIDRARAATAPKPGPRCSGHFEAHGRDFDLREAFARDPGRFDALRRRGAGGLRRPVEEPDRHRDAALPARPGARMRRSRRGATRCSPASRSTPPKAAPCCTPRCARRAAQGPFSDEVHDVLDAMLAYAETVRDTARQRHPPRRQHRHRRQRPRPADGGAGARRLRASGAARSTSSRNVDGHDIAPVLRAPEARARRCSSSRQQDLHDAGDDGQRACRARLVPRATAAPTSRSTSSRRPPTSQAAAAVRHRHHLRLLGLGRRPLLAVVARSACRSRSPSAPTTSARCSPARMRWTATSPRRRWRRTCRCCSACSTSGTATSTASRAAASRRTTRA